MLKPLIYINFIALLAFMFIIPTANHAVAKINLPPKCKLPHLTVNWGKAHKKSWAKRRARRQWRSYARRKHGWKYRNWSCAYKRKYNCKKRKGWWRCSAGAYACRC